MENLRYWTRETDWISSYSDPKDLMIGCFDAIKSAASLIVPSLIIPFEPY
jgi:hypothetical protein